MPKTLITQLSRQQRRVTQKQQIKALIIENKRLTAMLEDLSAKVEVTLKQLNAYAAQVNKKDLGKLRVDHVEIEEISAMVGDLRLDELFPDIHSD